jgi:DNA polymerase-1
LRKLLRDESPELIGVALDVGRTTFRSEKYEAYKANRAPMPEDLRSQIPLVRQALEAYRIPILELAGFEADDVLGTLARKAADLGFDVILVSADKDLMQLVEPHVFLYHTGRSKLYAPADVEEDFGVPPARVADVLALMGDTVDNVPGVPGIGEKGAKTLIQQYGSLEALLDRAAEVPRKGYRESLQEHRDQALLSKELTVIHTDVDVAFDPEALRHDPPDVEALRILFTDLDFFSLVEELGPGGGGTRNEAVVPARELETPEALRAALEAISASGAEVFAALLCEETPLGLAFGGGEPADSPDSAEAAAPEVFYADFRRAGLRDEALAYLKSWLADPQRRLAGHNLKEILRLVPEGEASRAHLFDLMLASYLLKPSIHGHTLEEMALERAGTKALTLKECGWDKGQEPPQGDSRLALFAAERVALARAMAGPVRRELAASAGLSAVYETIEAPLVPVLVGMEERGIRLDVEFLRGMSGELGTELAQLEEAIYREAGERFNLNSPQQLGTVLFERMGLPVLKRTQKKIGRASCRERVS